MYERNPSSRDGDDYDYDTIVLAGEKLSVDSEDLCESTSTIPSSPISILPTL
jgi:hypothetical protein